MFKKLKKHPVASIVLALGLLACIVGATTWDMTWARFTNIWIGATGETPTQTLGSNSAYVKGDVEIDGTLYADGALTVTGTLTEPTGGVTAGEIADVVRYYQLPLLSFSHNGSAAISSTTAPGIESDDSITAVVWADGETTPVQTTFRIPSDYSSGGAFKVFATESGTSTASEVDFDVYVNANGRVADSAATGQSPVALAGTASTGSEVTLTVATDFASLAAGDWVTLRIWRDNTATGTNDLEVKGVAFYYTATQ